jgi:hypothetical protein
VEACDSLACLADSRGSTTHLLLDSQGLIVGVLLGWPRDIQGWKAVHDGAFEALDKAANAIPDSLKKAHRRGDYPSLAHGLSFGGGQTARIPSFLHLPSLTLP